MRSKTVAYVDIVSIYPQKKEADYANASELFAYAKRIDVETYSTFN